MTDRSSTDTGGRSSSHASGRILHPAGEGVVFGAGCVARELADVLASVDARRPFVITTASVAASGVADAVASSFGAAIAGRFEGARQHTPRPVVLAASGEVQRSGADCIVSVGGGSVVDLAKGVALVAARGPGALESPGVVCTSPEDHFLPHVAVPTTLSGAEFTHGAGISDPATGEKTGYAARALAPRWVLLDPALARTTPAMLWASTGMKALADTVEMICSRGATTFSDAIALMSLTSLSDALPVSVADRSDLDAAGRCQLAVASTLAHLVGVGVGLVAALRHQLGSRTGVAHGIASTIMLPHVIRWNTPACEPAVARAATAVGRNGADDLAAWVEDLANALGIPRRLRDVGVDRAVLADVAGLVVRDPSLRTNPRSVTDVAEVEEILLTAY